MLIVQDFHFFPAIGITSSITCMPDSCFRTIEVTNYPTIIIVWEGDTNRANDSPLNTTIPVVATIISIPKIFTTCPAMIQVYKIYFT